jgi:spoIIIJ-associated protein
MEWVETTARTIEEAKEQALDQLGVAEDDAEFEVLDEPRAGLFGRVRGEARVRARVRPTQPRPKAERQTRRRRGEAGSETSSAPAEPSGAVATAADGAASAPRRGEGPRLERASAPRRNRPAARPPAGERVTRDDAVDAEQVGEEARRFMQGLVDAFGLTGTAAVRRDGDDLEVTVDGSDLGLLVGPRGSTLQAVQEIARVAAQRRLGDHDTRLRVDVGGYRERRRDALTKFATQVATEVVESGTARSLEPMASPDRKVIHDVLSEFDGVVTRSDGEDPHRRVVIAPTGV